MLDATFAELGMAGARFEHIERDRLRRMAKSPDSFMATMALIREARGS
jgi:hypothetical protein